MKGRAQQFSIDFMQINTNYNAGWFPTLAYAKAAAQPGNPAAGPAFDAKEQLDASLAQVPDVRPEQVARAARLIQAGGYPTAGQMDAMARRMAEALSAAPTPPDL